MKDAARLLAAVLVLGTLEASAQEARFVTAVFYGPEDRRQEPVRSDARVQAWADSTVALFQADAVSLDLFSRRARLASQPVGRRFNLCPDEPFYSQPSGAFCSGALVGPDLILTAGHCFLHNPCREARFVFGFTLGEGGRAPDTVPTGEVYACAEVVARRYVQANNDWALVRLDRPVTGHAPLPIDRSAGGPADGTPLLMIGHPSGLPRKTTGGARVYDASPENYFVSNLDNWAGNSGSPVFDARTGLIEGTFIYDDAGEDFAPRGSCNVSVRCPNDTCVGARATKVSLMAELIPPLPSSRLDDELVPR
ncbi:MAG: trypsin-like peptidase domain-containing protein [Elusimicrobia bacterium]|nr:trypsin-like peptidase domain-containing protein [Elusimicrobiota bacterium]